MLYNILTILEIMFYAAFIGIALGIGIAYGWKWWLVSQPRRRHKAAKVRLNNVGILETKGLDMQTAAQASLRFLGMPSVSAGDIIQHVPDLNPEKPEGDGQVIATARAIAYTRQGADPIDMIDLDKSRLLITSGGRAAILYRYDLTGKEEEYLEQQREDAVHRNDGIIEEFCGHQWKIRGAYGQNINPRPGERTCSYLQVLSLHKDLANDVAGIRSSFSTDLFDGQMHDYYDMRALCPDTEQYLLYFYSGGRWHCYIGRILNEDEANRMQIL